MALFLSCFLLNLLNFMNISNCKKRCPFLVCKLQQDIFIFLSVYFFSCFEFHVIVYFCSKKRLCFYLFFLTCSFFFLFNKYCQRHQKMLCKKCACIYLIFIIVFFSSFEFHEYLKLLRFQQVSCPESEVRHLSTTFQPFASLCICIFNNVVLVFLS